ncbi:hypothetical protein [Deinococcus sp.]|uniref:hypothetical protein n=1 Tax=Deinococcus sp. TaxID=47478 RepID=UPI0025FC1B81|nr:hypothetical protein [Deinococcus sp.]
MSAQALYIVQYDGDLLVFATLSLALSYIEVPEVESGEATLTDTSGVRYKLGVQRGGWFRPDQVVVTGTAAATDQEVSALDAELRAASSPPGASLWTLAMEWPLRR